MINSIELRLMHQMLQVSPVKLDLLVFPVFLELTDATELMVCLVFLVWSVTPVQEGNYQSTLHLKLFLNSQFFLSYPGQSGIKGEKGEAAQIIDTNYQKGQKGEPGFDGRVGNPGTPGLSGERGLPGQAGYNGVDGARGDKGDQGEKGDCLR
jgi:hypothetical protein